MYGIYGDKQALMRPDEEIGSDAELGSEVMTLVSIVLTGYCGNL